MPEWKHAFFDNMISTAYFQRRAITLFDAVDRAAAEKESVSKSVPVCPPSEATLSL